MRRNCELKNSADSFTPTARDQIAPTIGQRVEQVHRSNKSSHGLIKARHILWLGATIVLAITACSRSRYTQLADEQAYCLVNSRMTDHRWTIPTRTVEPQRGSRMELLADLDCSPKPPDDPAAVPLMNCPDGHRNDHYWSKIATAQQIETPAWLEYLPRNESGEILLTQPLAIDLALLHSRDYQTEYERVYLTSLALTGNQFEFSTQWFGGGGTEFNALEEDVGGGRILQVSDRLGFGRQLAGGGQFATNILNSFFWDFGSGGVGGSSGQIVSTFTQPLLRGAFRHVRLENLTQAERTLLYEVRDFARFRRQFYLQIVSSYLSLLTQVQSIRNAETNLESLRLNLVEHQELLALKMVSQIQVDQVFQDYQNGRLSLLAAEQGLAASLDQFKFQLGLPAWVQLKIDESLLAPFELTDARLASLDREAQSLYQSLLQFLPPEVASRQTLLDAFAAYQQLQSDVDGLLPKVLDELARLKISIEQGRASTDSLDDKLDFDQQAAIAERVGSRLIELEAILNKRESTDKSLFEQLNRYDEFIDSNAANSSPQTSVDSQPAVGNRSPQDEKPSEVLAWEAILFAIGRGLREAIAELTIAQTQIRLFLIAIEPINVDERAAINFAQQNRLDQMNRRAQVMDGFRRIEVAADLLQSELNVNGQVALGTDPKHDNAFRLDSSANAYRVGVQFDGPLNRLNERNVYRASQIAYQQATRNFVAGKDSIANEVRSALRQLNLRRLNFQIARQQLVAATRQVDEAQINLRTATQSSTNLTRDLLQSLQGQLNAKNNLIFNWIDYKIAKIRLFTSLELLYLDDNGVWFNESFPLDQLPQMVPVDEYFPPLDQVAFRRTFVGENADTQATPIAPEVFAPKVQTDFVENDVSIPRHDLTGMDVSSRRENSLSPVGIAPPILQVPIDDSANSQSSTRISIGRLPFVLPVGSQQ